MLIKTKNDIKKIMEGGQILGKILEKLMNMSLPGVSTLDIDKEAEKLIRKAGGRPSFKGYKSYPKDPPFPTSICASLNSELVHGIARKDVILKEGDIFTIDIGMEWPVKTSGGAGLFTDTAATVSVGSIKKDVKKLLNVTQSSLEAGIEAIRPGSSVADIGRAIETYVKSQGKYGVIRDLVGHGVGHAVHEAPSIPNFYDQRNGSFILKPGMVVALEPMISLGGYRIKTLDDDWTIAMEDGSLSAHFEHTIVVTEGGCEVATRRPSEN